LPDDLAWITDKTRLQIVFFNLISNAIQYQDKFKPTSYIRISCSRTNNQLLLQIEDNGIGIEQAYQDKVFDMFYRATVNSKGSGLGLYIVKEAVEKLGGTISLRSTHGEGTSFTLSLPRKELNSSASPSEF
jgi:signal transduction histidine kinase